MKKETFDLVIIVSGILLVILMGAGLLFLARWSRRKNGELRAKGDASQLIATKSIIRRGITGETAKAYFAGTLSGPEKSMGTMLAVIGIVACLVFLVFACSALIKLLG